MKAVYPGTFDPITNGHLDLITRSSKIVDELHILIADNPTKKPIFSLAERVEMIKLSTKDIKNVVIVNTSGLVVDYAKNNDIRLIVRGLRNFQDYENEFSLYQFNSNIAPNIETLILFPKSKNYFVSSSSIRELVSHKVDISIYVPKDAIKIILDKYK